MAFNFFKRKPKPAPETASPAEAPKPEAPKEEALTGPVPPRAGDPEPSPAGSDVSGPESSATSDPEPAGLSEQGEADTVHAHPAERPNDTGLFSKLKSGLSKTRKVLNTDITELFSRSTAIDENLFEELEELLVMSDLGVDVSMAMMERLRKTSKKMDTGEQVRLALKQELLGLFPQVPETGSQVRPQVIMVVGVNGTGKTTTLGKLATRYVRQGKKVLIAAADTFRAAAIEQVEIWADRANAGIVKHREGADPAAVAYDAVEAAMARGVDVVLIDTAGRLHTQKNLMEELKKIKRSVDKKLKGAPHQVMMVIDATTGQNAISQARIFNQAVGLTHMAVTKLDGTAKGGIVAAVSSSMNLPVSHIGVGEGIEDLQDFDAGRFVDALFD